MAGFQNRKALLDALDPNADQTAIPMGGGAPPPAMQPSKMDLGAGGAGGMAGGMASKMDLGAMSGTGGIAGGIAPGEGRPNVGPPPVLDQAIPAPAGAVQSAAAKPITLGSNGYSTTTPGRPFLLGFEASKLMDPNSGSAAGSKYTPAAKAFGQAYLGGTDIGRGNLQPMLDAIKTQFPNATSDGQQKIDFGDGNGLVDVIRSDGSIVFQNTTGNPTWEQKGYGGGGAPSGGAPGGAHGGGGAGLPSQLQGDPMAMIQEALGKYGNSPNLQALLAQLGAA